MSLKQDFDRIERQARAQALKCLRDAVKPRLPWNWSVILAVGWGTHYMDDGGMVLSPDETDGLLRVTGWCDDFIDRYEAGNEMIHSTRRRKK